MFRRQGSKMKTESEMTRSAFGENGTGNILVVVDGGELDGNLVTLGCLLARGANLKVYFVHIIEIPRTLPLKAVVLETSEQADRLLASAMLIAEKVGCQAVSEIVQARLAGSAIVDEAKAHNCSLLLIGCMRRPKWSANDLDQVVSYVLAHAHCRVWLVQDVPNSTEVRK